jgi:enediyne polyketide synthase
MQVPDQVNISPAQPVAIAGAALRFPGAADPASFHELIVTGRRMFREFSQPADGASRPGGGPASRRRALAALLDDEGRGLGRDDELTGGVTARHILAAETACAALADVPPAGRAMARGRIGVFFADIPEPGTADVAGWVRRHLKTRGEVRPATAGERSAAPAGGGRRPAQALLPDLVLGAIDAASVAGRGVVQEHVAGLGAATLTAGGPSGSQPCSLRAVTAACEALAAGEFDLVLAGGVARRSSGWAGARARGSSGRAAPVRVYDARPTGPLPGEGCGVVALMRAADARAADVPGYAEIAGWHHAGPFTAPRKVLAEAYVRAGIDPADVQLVEGHGAANAADDQAELEALLAVLGSGAARAGGRCVLGSVAANIGDTRAASGIAALLKAAFAMTADVIPPATGCVQPNQLLRGALAAFRVPSEPEPWPQTHVQLAAVNTLGVALYPEAPRSGPVHVVLRRERDPAERPGRRRKDAPLARTVGSAPA